MVDNPRHGEHKRRVLTESRPGIILVMLAGIALSFHPLSAPVPAAETLPGEYQILEDEPSLHNTGQVLLLEFVDFYCPHCHHFDSTVVSALKKEFGDRLIVRLVGFPVIRGALPTAFEMYEQARFMGQGAAMKDVLFQTIHRDKIRLFDKGLRALLATKIGLDRHAFEAGLASGGPYRAFENGKAWGERIGVTHTPTVVLDGDLKVNNLGIDNVRALINSILKRDNVRSS